MNNIHDISVKRNLREIEKLQNALVERLSVVTEEIAGGHIPDTDDLLTMRDAVLQRLREIIPGPGMIFVETAIDLLITHHLYNAGKTGQKLMLSGVVTYLTWLRGELEEELEK